MAKTTVPIELSSTPSIVDNGDATAITIDSSGDISFYEDTGTTASLFWDSSLTSLKITGRETSRSGNTYAFEVDNSTQVSNLTSAGAMRVKGALGDSFIVNGLGDVYFFDDSGTAQVQWDASAERLGIGITSPSYKLHVSGTQGSNIIRVQDTGNTVGMGLGATSTGAEINWGGIDVLKFVNVSTEQMRIDSSGNVGIGGTSGGERLLLEGSATANAKIKFSQTTAGLSSEIQQGSTGMAIKAIGSNPMLFETNGSERMRIDSSGYITTPNQVMFHAGGLSSTSYTVNYSIAFNTERFDRGGNFNTSNGIFTAPVTGIYHFDTTVLITGASSSYTYDLQLYTSNKTYYAQSRNQYSSGSTGWNDNYLAHTGSWTVDMDAGDTAYIRYGTFGGGGLWTDSAWTHFSGYLIG